MSPSDALFEIPVTSIDDVLPTAEEVTDMALYLMDY